MELDRFIKNCLTTIQSQAFAHFYWRTFDVIKADSEELKDIAYRLRYEVYCKDNNFLPAENYPDGREKDQFDDHATHFLLYHKPTDSFIGTLRLNVPQPRNPLTSFELQKLCDHPLLQIENRVMGMCEISRFCMVSSFRKRDRDGSLLPAYYEQQGSDEENCKPEGIIFFRRRIPYAPLGLLQAAFKEALVHKITNCVMALEPRQIPAFARLGMTYRVLGPRLSFHGEQQPLIFNIKAVLDKMAENNPACWEVASDQGKLQETANLFYNNDWQDAVFDAECRKLILSRLL